MFAANGRGPSVLAQLLGEELGALALDADALYVSSTSYGRALKLSLDGGTPEPLVTDLGVIGGIAVDRDWVYVAASTQGKLVRVPKDGSASRPDGPVTGPCPTPLGTAEAIAATPRVDANLELLAQQLDRNEVVATQATYDRVVADIQAIRAANPALADIGFFARHDGKTLMLTTNDTTGMSIEAHEYLAWDCLNTFYGLDSIQFEHSFIGPWATVKLKGSYNLPKLAELYSMLPGITRAAANSGGGDSSTLCAYRSGDTIEYVVDRRDGDCPAGCITSDARGFTSKAPGMIAPLGSWNSESNTPKPDWLVRACAR
jgi:hypothetical protein